MMKKWIGAWTAIAVLFSVFAVQAASASATSGELLNRAKGGQVTVGNSNSPAGEGKDNAFDAKYHTKWLVFANSAWIQYQFADGAAYAINEYKITSANDYPERDPSSWQLEGSNDGTNWTVLDSRQDQRFANRYESQTYSFPNTVGYSYYRFDFANTSGVLQLADIELFDGTTYEPPVALHPIVTASGENAPNEGAVQIADGTSTTKWLTYQSSGDVQFDFGQAITLDGYAITAANDASERDPENWTLQASNDGSAWTTIDTRSGEQFERRHQRNYYPLDVNSTAYRYYKFNLKNHSGDILQVGEIEFSYLEDPWHAIAPAIDIQSLDPTPKGALFEQALPDAKEQVTAIIRKIVSMLYPDPEQLHIGPKAIHIRVKDEPGVAAASGSGGEAELFFSSQYLNDVYNSDTPLRQELIGVLYHELTHLYQYDDNSYGDIGYMIEGFADAVRFENGYHDRYAMQPGGTWKDGYGTTGNFLRWIGEYKKPGFLREINASLDPFDGVDWTPDVFRQLTGEDVDTLWSEYQASLGAADPVSLAVQYKADDANAGDNQIAARFNIKNNGTSPVDLSGLKLRYYFTQDASAPAVNAWCDYAQIGSANVSESVAAVSPAKTGADAYVELSFSDAAGTIPAGGQSGDIQVRLTKSDWSNFNEGDDYSYDGSVASFIDWSKATLYRNGTLVWGVEP